MSGFLTYYSPGRKRIDMLNIAICDDNSVQSEMIQTAVDHSLNSLLSYNLCLFHDGKLFEHEILSRHCSYDIVILDIELGNSSKSGIELAKQINYLNPMTQIIFISQCLEYAPDVYVCRHTYFISRDRISLTAFRSSGEGGILHLETGAEIIFSIRSLYPKPLEKQAKACARCSGIV